MHRVILALVLLITAPLAYAEPLVVYSGRSKVLVDPLVRRFEAETGIPVRVRYGKDAQLFQLLLEEGRRSPADVFWANSVGALVRAERSGLFAPLAPEVLKLPARFVPASGRWIPVTFRMRVLAVREGVDPEPPASVLELPKIAAYAGRVGWTPRYSSFVDFVTALRAVHGEAEARKWLLGMKALGPRSYATNVPMILDLARGAIDLALTNHYYVLRVRYGDLKSAPRAKGAPVRLHAFADGDVGNLALVTGAGVLAGSKRAALAERFLRFLLGEEAQRFFAEAVHEYPLRPNTPTPPVLLPLESALRKSQWVDPEVFADTDVTLRLLREVGLY